MLPRDNRPKAFAAGPVKLAVLYLVVAFGIMAVSPSPRALAENKVVRFFQEHISPADGDRCPMVPSCSAYAAGAVEKHGLLLGWIMACDRLVRCGRDEADLSGKIRVNGEQYVLDRVEDNDFWWFSPKDDK